MPDPDHSEEIHSLVRRPDFPSCYRERLYRLLEQGYLCDLALRLAVQITDNSEFRRLSGKERREKPFHKVLLEEMRTWRKTQKNGAKKIPNPPGTKKVQNVWKQFQQGYHWKAYKR